MDDLGNKAFIEMIVKESEYFSIIKNTIISAAPKINDNDLDDCISEVYVAILQQDNLDKHPNFKGWLYIASQNVAKRYMKKQTIERINLLNITDDFTDPTKFEEVIESKEQNRELLSLLLKKLTSSEYRLFELRFLKRKSNQEIADIIGIKKASVETKVIRLRKKIKNILKKV